MIRAAIWGLLLLACTAAAAPPAILTVPFRYPHHEIAVNVFIAGSGPYAFLLDTGTTPSVVDAALAKHLGLRPEGVAGHGSDLGSSSTTTIYPITVRNVRVGGLHVERLDAVALDISGIGKRLGIPLAGVLGSNFFDGRVVQIDYPCRRVSVLADGLRAPFTARFKESALGWIVTGDAWVGSRRVSATIDTGNSDLPIVTGAGIAALQLQAAARAGMTVSSLSYGGRHSETLGVLRNVRLGSTGLGTLNVRFLPQSNDSFAINLGNQPFQHFVVTFDYVRGLLTVSPARACSTLPRPAPLAR